MKPEVITTIRTLQKKADALRCDGKIIALVPTMGYLHAGHKSLIVRARTMADVVIVSIFVNPTQFAPNEDYQRYPRDIEHDLVVIAEAGGDIVFYPAVDEMYHPAFSTYVDVGEVSQRFEGQFRPTHFRGVTTVVAKLLNITKPHIAIFGQKDAQQAFIIQKMVRDLNFDVDIKIAPIVREPDGLAMSSRNVYLSADERKRAAALYRALSYAQETIRKGVTDIQSIYSEMYALIQSSHPTQIDYIAFINPETFEELTTLEVPVLLIAVAVRYGSTRLIDNIIIHRK